MDKSFSTKIIEKFGFVVEPSHYNKNLFFFINWFFKDYKNTFLYVMSKNNWFFGGTINIQFVRPFLNKLRGVKIGKKVAVGDDACIGLTYPELIEIGDNCRISNSVKFIEHGRNLKSFTTGSSILDQKIVSKKIIIEADCHIGVGSIILPGVTIGRGSVIGAGTVVRESVEPYSLVLGNPGKVVKKFD